MDWIFQWRWEAFGKSKHLLPLLVHAAIYTLGFIPAFWWYEVSFAWLILVFASHAFLDQRAFERWVLEKFKGFTKEVTQKEGGGDMGWQFMLVGVDQVLHLVVLAFIVLLS